MKNTPPCVLAIHDLSGFGRGSLTTVLSVLAAMGIQACPMPTSLLSAHTEFEDFSFLDLTGEMHKFIQHWQSLDLKFDAIYSGFLGSPLQASLVAECIETFSHSQTITVIDPVLGDNGTLYPTMNSEMVQEMRKLVAKAHIITPNLTEAALLLNEPCPKSLDKTTLFSWLRRLADLGPNTVIITSAIIDDESATNSASAVLALQRSAPLPVSNAINGIRTKNGLATALPDKKKEQFWQISCEYIPAFYPGTGDIFASVITGATLWREELPVGIARAMRFIANGIEQSVQLGLPSRNGILLELVLDSLKGPLNGVSSQELLEHQSE